MKVALFIGLLLVVSQCQFINNVVDYTTALTSSQPLQRFKICDLTASKKELQSVIDQVGQLSQQVNMLLQNQVNLKNQITTLSSSQSSLHYQTGRHSLQWSTGHPLSSGTGPRQQIYSLKFKKPFTQIPQVVASIGSLDQAVSSNIRLRVSVKNITTTGFDLVYITWNTSIVHSAEATWVALGK